MASEPTWLSALLAQTGPDLKSNFKKTKRKNQRTPSTASSGKKKCGRWRTKVRLDQDRQRELGDEVRVQTGVGRP